MTDLLLIVPHPDDEAFGIGATLARASASGLRVATLTLTRGRAGRTLGLCTQEELPAQREAELRGSLDALGVADVTILDHPDYVPDADRGLPPHRGLETVPAETVVADIRAVLERTAPRAVVTFGPNGSNGHPDHVCTHHRVVEALAESDHRPEALYYYASPKPYDGEGRPGFLDPAEIRARQLLATHHLPVGAFMEQKLRAVGHHRTQALSVVTFMRDLPDRLVVETFHRADPPFEGEPILDAGAL